MESISADYNTTIIAPADPTKDEYVFAGWFKDSQLTEVWDFENDKVPADNVTLYAKWAPAICNIEFNTNGGSEINSVTASYNTTIAKPSNPGKEHYTFIGWYKEAELTNEWIFESDKVTDHMTLYAKWQIDTYTVSFDSNEGSAVDDIIADYDAKITAPSVPIKTGYTFAGWYKEEGLINAWDFDSDAVTYNITLYAKWETAVFTVTFKDNYGNIYYSIDTEYNTTIEEPYPPILKNEKIFTGWYKNSAATIAWDFSFDKVTDNVTLYAGTLYRSTWLYINTNGGSQVSSVRAYL